MDKSSAKLTQLYVLNSLDNKQKNLSNLGNKYKPTPLSLINRFSKFQ